MNQWLICMTKIQVPIFHHHKEVKVLQGHQNLKDLFLVSTAAQSMLECNCQILAAFLQRISLA